MAAISLLFLLLTNGNDLLSNIDTKSYWELKNIQVTESNMLSRLKPVNHELIEKHIKQLTSPDKEVVKKAFEWFVQYNMSLGFLAFSASKPYKLEKNSHNLVLEGVINGSKIMRLMAIKTLGELKNKKALPELNKLLKSDDIWDVIYAAQAIEKITGQKINNSLINKNKLKLPWLINKNTIMIGKASYENMDFNLFPIFNKKFPINKKDRSDIVLKIKKDITNSLLNIVEGKGNICIKNINFSIDQYQDKIQNKKYGITITLDGIFTESIFGSNRQGQATIKQYGEFSVYTENKSTCAYLNNNKRMLIIRTGNFDQDPFREPQKFIRSLKYGDEILKKDPILTSYIKKINLKSRIWFAGILPDDFKRNSPYNLIQNITGEINLKNKFLKARFIITSNEEDTDKLVSIINNKSSKKIEMIKSFQKQLSDESLKLKLKNLFSIQKINMKNSEIKIQINNIEKMIHNLLYSYVMVSPNSMHSPGRKDKKKLE